MSDKDKTIKEQGAGVLDEKTQAIMDEINQKMQAVKQDEKTADVSTDVSTDTASGSFDDQSNNEAVEENAKENAKEDAKEDSKEEKTSFAATNEAAASEANPDKTKKDKADPKKAESNEADSDKAASDKGNPEEAQEDEEPYEQSLDEEYMTRKERKEAKKLAKEAEKKRELEKKIEAEAAKREDPNRASNGLRGFGLFTIFMFMATTALGVILVWYFILSPDYVKENGQKEFVFPEISSASDASVWEELTVIGYVPHSTDSDADVATALDATKETSEDTSEAEE